MPTTEELNAAIEAVYFEAHKDFVRRWLLKDREHFERHGRLPDMAERKCKKVTGLSSREFYRMWVEQKAGNGE